jgi:hypothetical protein
MKSGDENLKEIKPKVQRTQSQMPVPSLSCLDLKKLSHQHYPKPESQSAWGYAFMECILTSDDSPASVD